ncbi:SLC13 family permease [Peribacillus butanolivorans]|uniref:SLC13 family permease n=1 Tax=Peribacillus butanolivorans TaxID=421767 RepID=UPI00365A0BE0
MTIIVLSLVVMFVMFTIAAILPINLGIMGFVASLIIGIMIGGLSAEDVIGLFPADIIITIIGMTYLFVIVQKNGAIDLLTSGGLKLVKGNIGFMPWIMFFLSLLITSVGTFPTATVAILAPIALRFAFKYHIDPIIMSVMVVIGSVGGYYSPINTLGIIVKKIALEHNIVFSPLMLFINNVFFCFFVCLIIFVIFGGLRLFTSNRIVNKYVASTLDVTQSQTQTQTTSWISILSLLSILCVLLLSVSMDINIGLAGFLLGFLLSLQSPKKHSKTFSEMPWGVIVMLSGIITYIGVLDKIGTVSFITDVISTIPDSSMATLVSSYVGGFVSSFASTTGFLAFVIPLTQPILENSSLTSIAVISTISISSAIVDVSPFSTNGALVLANAQGMNSQLLFRRLLILSGCLILLGPGLAWVIFTLFTGHLTF